MRIIIFGLLFLCLSGSALSYTSAELLASINFARTNPRGFAEAVKSLSSFYTNGAWKYSSETNCYQNAFDWLSAAPAVPALQSSTVAIAAALGHSRWMASTFNDLSHTGKDGSSISTRFTALSTWDWANSNYKMAINENIAVTPSKFVSVNDWTFMWIADCGLYPTKGHRDNIFSTRISHYGCAEAVGTWVNKWENNRRYENSIFATCDGNTAVKPLDSFLSSAIYTEAQQC